MSPAPKQPDPDEPKLEELEELEELEPLEPLDEPDSEQVPEGEDGPRKAADDAVAAPVDLPEAESDPEPTESEAEGSAAAETGIDKRAAEAVSPKASRRGNTVPRRQQSGGEKPEAAVFVKAQAKYVRTSARKARLVCDHIRGKDVEQARAILAFTPRGAAEAWTKLLESAVANAEHNHELVGDELRIHAVHADEGPTLKRFRPRAMGRATKIRKRTSHLSITLTPKA
jgi:ribosomal protein L22